VFAIGAEERKRNGNGSRSRRRSRNDVKGVVGVAGTLTIRVFEIPVRLILVS